MADMSKLAAVENKKEDPPLSSMEAASIPNQTKMVCHVKIYVVDDLVLISRSQTTRYRLLRSLRIPAQKVFKDRGNPLKWAGVVSVDSII